MIALKLTDVKTFMNQLLCSEVFDHFLLPEVSIAKDATFTIDGHINTAYYSKDELEEQDMTASGILPYSKLRPVCYQLIRGRHTPVFFKFILMLSPKNAANILARSGSSFTIGDIQGFFINLTFQNGELLLTTGISYGIFSTDRKLDQEWDILVQKFLNKHKISYEEL